MATRPWETWEKILLGELCPDKAGAAEARGVAFRLAYESAKDGYEDDMLGYLAIAAEIERISGIKPKQKAIDGIKMVYATEGEPKNLARIATLAAQLYTLSPTRGYV